MRYAICAMTFDTPGRVVSVMYASLKDHDAKNVSQSALTGLQGSCV